MIKKIVVVVTVLLLAARLTMQHGGEEGEHKPEDKIEGVVDLTEKNKKEFLDGSKHVLAEFYAPWCGHCKHLAPEMFKLGAAMKAANPKDVAVVKANCVAESKLCQEFGVQGYPTLKWFAKGGDVKKPEDYNSGRTLEDMIEFINGKAAAGLRPPPKPFDFVVELTSSNFDKIVMDPAKDVIVKFFAPWCGHCKHLAPVYRQFAQAFQGEKGVVVAELDADKYKDLAERYGIRGFPTIKFFPRVKKGGDATAAKKEEDFGNGRELHDFVSFMNEKAGTFRSDDGSLNDSAGTDAVLDEIAKNFAKAAAGSDERKKLAQECAAKAKDSTSPKAEYYAKVMARLDADAAFPKKELARLTKLMAGDNVAPENKDDFKMRTNILQKF